MDWIILQLVLVASHVKAIAYTATHLLIACNATTPNPTRTLQILLAYHVQRYNMVMIFSKAVSNVQYPHIYQIQLTNV